ncbi:MAG TPA: helix-turn-helix domain-containing protein [Thermoanaerobaculia bacterium]|jgi:AraC-like DNA-binding protein|nr:helix-turn-helix domain-containing protein [Thermoanaerobaculia bacterium]
MSYTKEELDTGIATYLAFCHQAQTAARASELATFLRIGYRSLRRACNRVLGMPVSLAIRERQLEVAVRLLRETDLALDEIGLIAGFGDRRTFFRAVRNRFACSPLMLRKDGQIFPSTDGRAETTLACVRHN